MQFASPKGRGPNIDPISQSTFAAYMGNFVAKNRDNKLFEQMKNENNLNNPRPFASISDEELATFSGVFIPGGHAPLTDLGDKPDLGRILLHFHNANKPTGMLFCQLNTPFATRSPPMRQLSFATGRSRFYLQSMRPILQVLRTRATRLRLGLTQKRASSRP